MSFTGRPPLLSRRFITTPLPLDLKDEYIFLDQESMTQKATKTLDEHGWSIERGLYSSSIIRARCMAARVREEIVEVALGHESDSSANMLQSVYFEPCHSLERQLTSPEQEFSRINRLLLCPGFRLKCIGSPKICTIPVSTHKMYSQALSLS